MWSPGLAALLTQLLTTRSLRGMGWRLGSVRFLGIAWILPVVYALPAYAFAWLTGLGIFPNPARIARLAEDYSYTSTTTTVAIFVTMYAISIIGLSFPFAWLTLKSGSLWPAVLFHAFHNQLVQGIIDKLTGKIEITSYITGEFGVGLALTSIVVAYILWRMQRDKSLTTRPVSAQPVVQPE